MAARSITTLIAVAFGVFCSVVARADTVQIAAVGASIVCGKGVGQSSAWPAQLEGMLRAKGLDVSMAVSCQSGDSGDAILGRVGSLPAAAKVVLYNTGGTNNASGENSSAIGSQLERAIRARGAIPIRVQYHLPASLLQSDGIHPTEAGHRQIAAGLVSRVSASIGKKKAGT